MLKSNSTFKITAFNSLAVIAALVLGACASTSEKPAMRDTTASTDNRVIDTAGVAASSGTSGETLTLILEVSGYEEHSGQIMVAVYNSEASFDSEGEPFRSAKVAVDGAQTSIAFGNLSAGDYAFKVFHDANDNGKLDTNVFGMPTEKYAFSRDASDPFSAPEWGESKISLEPGDDVQTVSFD